LLERYCMNLVTILCVDIIYFTRMLIAMWDHIRMMPLHEDEELPYHMNIFDLFDGRKVIKGWKDSTA